MTLPIRRRPCKDCSRLMVGYSQQWYCGECSRRRKQEADARSKVRQREPLLDLSESEIEARFQSALREIKKHRSSDEELQTVDYNWRYQEP